MSRIVHIIKSYTRHDELGTDWLNTYCGTPTKWSPDEKAGESGWANADTIYKYCAAQHYAICPDCEASSDFVMKLLAELP